MPSKFHKVISLFLSAWLCLFVFLSAAHIDHSHELLPVEQSMCDEDCNKKEHRTEGESCDWFIAQRIISNDEIQLNTYYFNLNLFSIVIPHETHHVCANFSSETYATRAPPILPL